MNSEKLERKSLRPTGRRIYRELNNLISFTKLTNRQPSGGLVIDHVIKYMK
jgi:hypothetical protein